MKCPFCRSSDTEVYNTRSTKFGTQLWRRRRCASCHEAFTTYETADMGFLWVTRPGGRKIRYSRAQLFSSLSAAFLDIPHRAGAIDAITDTIESKLLDLKQPAVSSDDIARVTLTTLKHFNAAAFLRYLATHAELATPAQIKREVKKY